MSKCYVDPLFGEELSECIARCMRISAETKDAVFVKFNGVLLVITPKTNPAIVMPYYHSLLGYVEQ